jgi:hypothetical protein
MLARPTFRIPMPDTASPPDARDTCTTSSSDVLAANAGSDGEDTLWRTSRRRCGSQETK